MIQTDEINAKYNDFISGQNHDLISRNLILKAIELRRFSSDYISYQTTTR